VAPADGKQVWFTLKDVGRTTVFEARPPFAVLKTIDTGPITNHVNIVRNAHSTGPAELKRNSAQLGGLG
jgi:hypothetical protein